MKKFMLVLLMGLVLAFDLYGVMKDIIDYYKETHVVEIDRSYTTVYLE